MLTDTWPVVAIRHKLLRPAPGRSTSVACCRRMRYHTSANTSKRCNRIWEGVGRSWMRRLDQLGSWQRRCRLQHALRARWACASRRPQGCYQSKTPTHASESAFGRAMLSTGNTLEVYCRKALRYKTKSTNERNHFPDISRRMLAKVAPWSAVRWILEPARAGIALTGRRARLNPEIAWTPNGALFILSQRA